MRGILTFKPPFFLVGERDVNEIIDTLNGEEVIIEISVIMKPSDFCKKFNVQNCHDCERVDCVDNMQQTQLIQEKK